MTRTVLLVYLLRHFFHNKYLLPNFLWHRIYMKIVQENYNKGIYEFMLSNHRNEELVWL